jgi:hypothetical protein
MLKSLTLALVLGATLGGLAAIPAEARTRNTAAQCQALYDQSRLDPQSYRATRDAYISCVSNL